MKPLPPVLTFARPDHIGTIDATCPSCSATLATYPPRLQVHTRLNYYRPKRAVLEPGFVPARQRHDTGVPHYLPQRLRTTRAAVAPERPLRSRVVVTCRCGQDIDLPPVDDAWMSAILKARAGDA